MSPQNKAAPPPPPSAGRSNRGVVHGIIGQLNESNQKRNPEAFLLPITALQVNPDQPRRTQNAELDKELAEDIRANGILEPLVVRSAPGKNPNTYQIVAGERRYRAAQTVGLGEVPVILKHFDDKQVRFISLAENLQRAELDELDEARYFQILSDEYNYSQQEIADMIHKSKSYVQRRFQLLRQSENGIEPEIEPVTEPADSEISNNRAKKERLRENSQSSTRTPFKPVATFTKFLVQVREKLPDLAAEERQSLLEQLHSMREMMEELEQSLEESPSPKVSRETRAKR